MHSLDWLNAMLYESIIHKTMFGVLRVDKHINNYHAVQNTKAKN